LQGHKKTLKGHSNKIVWRTRSMFKWTNVWSHARPRLWVSTFYRYYLLITLKQHKQQKHTQTEALKCTCTH